MTSMTEIYYLEVQDGGVRGSASFGGRVFFLCPRMAERKIKLPATSTYKGINHMVPYGENNVPIEKINYLS